MKKMKFNLIAALILSAVILAAVGPVKASPGSVIDFESLAEGAIVSSVSSGAGISGDPINGSVAIFGTWPGIQNVQADMIFDATCQPGGQPSNCTGKDADLFNPSAGNVLIVSQNLDSNDPNDADTPDAYLEFDFNGFGSGLVTVESLLVGDVDPGETKGKIELFRDQTLLSTVPVPQTGDGGHATLPVNVSKVDFMRIKMWGSGSVDAIAIQAEPTEVLYLSNTILDKDGKSDLYRVDLDLKTNQANLTLLPNGHLSFDQIDTIAATPNGAKIYMVDDLGTQMLSYYDVASASVVNVGLLNRAGETFFGRVDQAAFSLDRKLYITSTITDILYRVDLTTAKVIGVGRLINQATGAVVNIQGGDIAFSSDGTLYLWVNGARTGAPAGLYSAVLPAVNKQVMATFIGAGSDEHHFTGLASRAGGCGDIVGSTREDEIHVVDKVTGNDVMSPLPLMLNGVPFDVTNGDMSIGPFLPCAATAGE